MTGIVHLGPRLSVNCSPLSPIAPLCPPLQNPNPFSDFPEPNVHLIKARLNPLPSIQNRTSRTGQPGQDCPDRTVKTGCQHKTARIRNPGQDRKERTTRPEQNGKAKTGRAEHHRHNRTGQDSQSRTTKSRNPGEDSQERTARAEQPRQDFISPLSFPLSILPLFLPF
jgi:hypothetical protein